MNVSPVEERRMCTVQTVLPLAAVYAVSSGTNTQNGDIIHCRYYNNLLLRAAYMIGL